MKKLVLVAAFAIVGSVAFAQKPSGGNITTEIGLTSVIGTPATPANPSGLAQGMLRGRYFLNEGMAVRVGFGLGMGSTTTTLANTQETVAKTTGFGLAVGVEKHLEGTAKLSPYLGAELAFGIGSGSSETTNFGGTAGDKQSITGGGTTAMGLNALIGADYYIAEKVYIGAELGVMIFGSTTVADTETETTIGGVTGKATTTGSKGSNFGINPAALGQVRIGLILF